MMEIPQYSKMEYERRWLLPLNFPRPEAPLNKPVLIEDRYFQVGRLRLRKMLDTAGGETKFKLCKKYGSMGEGEEPIVNIYLSPEEFGLLSTVPAFELRKERYRLPAGYSLDYFQGEMLGLVIAEAEVKSRLELERLAWPENALAEVTSDSFFRGSILARSGNADLHLHFARIADQVSR
jgi:CYTH domain-containing protein